MSLLHSGADVLASYLFTTGIVTIPSQNKPWPLYLNSMPEKPDEAITVFDTAGLEDGKVMKTGTTLFHPGYQFRLRVINNSRAVAKGLEIETYLDSILREEVVIPTRPDVPTKTYLLQAIRRTSNVIPIGAEEGGSRLIYTLNGLITYSESL